MQEIKALTSMRGIFALWVMSYHLLRQSSLGLPDPLGIFSKGYLGVDFFFLLSGFVLAAANGGRFGAGSLRRHYLDFMVRRIGRMYPLHIVVTAGCVFVAWRFGEAYSPYQVITESLLIHRWPFVPAIFQAINGPAWSISVEILANALFPMFVLMTLTGGRTPAIITGTSAMAGIYLLGLSNHGSLDLVRANTLAPTGRCFCEFSLGMLAYRWRTVPIHADWIVIALAVAAAVASKLKTPDSSVIVLMVLIIAAISANVGIIQKILEFRLLHVLGELSYSIYLVHLPISIAVIHFFGKTPTIAFLLIVLLTVGASVLSFRLIEVPMRAYSKAWAQHLGSSTNQARN